MKIPITLDFNAKNAGTGELLVALAAAAIGVPAFIFAMLIGITLIDSAVALQLWRWFVQPAFADAPMLSLWTMWGLVLIWRVMDPFEHPSEREGQGKVKSPWLEMFYRLVVYPLAALASGYFVHRFFQ